MRIRLRQLCLDSFLAYAQRFDIIPQPGVSARGNARTLQPDPSSRMYVLKRPIRWRCDSTDTYTGGGFALDYGDLQVLSIAQNFGSISTRQRRCFGLFTLRSIYVISPFSTKFNSLGSRMILSDAEIHTNLGSNLCSTGELCTEVTAIWTGQK